MAHRIGTWVRPLAAVECAPRPNVEMAYASQWCWASTPRCRILTDGHAARGATEAWCFGGFVFSATLHSRCEVASPRPRPRRLSRRARSVDAGSHRGARLRAGARVQRPARGVLAAVVRRPQEAQLRRVRPGVEA